MRSTRRTPDCITMDQTLAGRHARPSPSELLQRDARSAHGSGAHLEPTEVMHAAVELPVQARHRTLIVVGVHVVLAALAYLAAFSLRFDFGIPAPQLRRFALTLPYLLVVRVVVLYRLGVFRGSWRHVGMRDLVALSTATTLASLLFVATLFVTGNLVGMPRSVLVADWVLFLFLAGGIRFATRCAREGQFPLQASSGRRTLVIGAGGGAERLLRQTFHDGRRSMRFVGLVDDDRALRGMALHGVRVLGTIDDLQRLVDRHDIELLVIAITSVKGEQMRRIVRRCEETQIPFKALPSLQELVDGTARQGQLRDVQIEDLLGREPIRLDMHPLEADLAGKTVLITGGAGSIGSELARQIATLRPARLILFEQAESPLYFVHLELANKHPTLELIPLVGDVTDASRVHEVFAAHRPDYVFHAAAYKHVPMMEMNVREAVRNNVLGTLRVAEASARFAVRRFVLISTDKAVNPSSIMGTTKRLAERIVLGLPALRASATDFRAVRFGNVLGSDGSVVPLFRKQLAAGGPLTVTHPDVRRYFMSIPEAVQLVLQAAALPEAAGRIAMLDMGEPVRITHLAEQLIRLSGLTPYQDIGITFTGLRPGEKMHEELTSLLETSLPTALDKVRVVQTDEVEGAALQAGLRSLLRETAHGKRSAIVRALECLVPEYHPRPLEHTLEREVAVPHGFDVADGSVPVTDDASEARFPPPYALGRDRSSSTSATSFQQA